MSCKGNNCVSFLQEFGDFVNVSSDALGIFENSVEKTVLQNLTDFSLNRSY